MSLLSLQNISEVAHPELNSGQDDVIFSYLSCLEKMEVVYGDG